MSQFFLQKGLLLNQGMINSTENAVGVTGVRKVLDGVTKVSDGGRDVSDGVGKLSDGARKVLNGVRNLSDGGFKKNGQLSTFCG